jgi:uncharacterized protein YkwD
MARWGTLFLVLLVLVLGGFRVDVLAVGMSTEVAADSDVFLPVVTKSELDFEQQVVVLTNQARISNGCNPVTVDYRLQAAAEGHSQDMAVRDYFDHISPDGTSPWDRIRAQGYSYSLAGENVAAGYSSPESVVAGWMASAGHRANILNCGFVHIGVGYYFLRHDTGNVNYNHYWTQVFASP